MSKVVKSVTRSISKVVSGVGKLVRSVVGGVVKGIGGIVSKIARSKLGKILLMAATIYFGGAAIMGGMQGAAAGSGFWGTMTSAIEGAGTGIANAWSSLGSAIGSATSGNFAQAGQQLAAGFNGTTTSALAGQVAPTVGAATAAPATTTTAAAATAPTATTAATAAAPASSSTSLFSSELAKYGAVTGGMQLAGSLISGYGQQKTMEEQRLYEEEQARLARERADANMSTSFQFGAPGDSPMAGTGTTSSGLNYTSYSIPTPTYQPVQYQPPVYSPYTSTSGGLIGSQMGTLTQFPVYNPALATYGYR